MRQLISRPGKLGTDDGGQELRDLYAHQSAGFSFVRLNMFARLCYTGTLKSVIQVVQSGDHPPLDGTETPFKFGYATLVIAGAQRLQVTPPGSGLHAETLRFLLARGCPPDVEDICQYTALHHATMNHLSRPDLARILLEKNSKVDHLNIYGSSPIMGALMAGHTGAVDVLMEFGADLTIPDADGTTAERIFVSCGPQVTAVVTKWLRHRTGMQAPMDAKKCDYCGKVDDVKLKICAACHSVRYCSTACQRSHWKTHKYTCKPFSSSNTVTVKPFYSEHGNLMPTAEVTRGLLGMQVKKPLAKHQRASEQPTSYPKSIVIKVQVPYDPNPSVAHILPLSRAPLLVYTKKRDFVCHVTHEDNATGYDHIAEVVRSKGVGGAKAYFAAELKSADELVVKVSELLAEQPF
ncbi:hypothetical protein EW146_g6000 [Bondarzewia mesenterica]|uniref:MYND-type domain-containing protein n=1 Tax=Bondarzewia mesenterica TaxID=1095465 RepID=A0A4V3XEN8_9AGAM|nr:hypothetical protein EW146_g6000 [Bondarzewia mesenterica]